MKILCEWDKKKKNSFVEEIKAIRATIQPHVLFGFLGKATSCLEYLNNVRLPNM